MGTLYTNLADVYEMMYRTFINYDEEFVYYNNIIKNYSSEKILELGCGTGNLAEKFIEAGYLYSGADLSSSMLAIAVEKYPGGNFFEADMRSFRLLEKQDACFFAGRTSAYLVSDDDMMKALQCINQGLKTGGIVCFDCIDAEKFIPLIKDGKKVVHTAAFESRRFHRASYWTPAEAAPGAFNWLSVYFEIDETGGKKEIGRDNSVLRSFSKAEITRMLNETGFDVKELNDRPSYAFETFVVTAQKK